MPLIEPSYAAYMFQKYAKPLTLGKSLKIIQKTSMAQVA